MDGRENHTELKTNAYVRLIENHIRWRPVRKKGWRYRGESGYDSGSQRSSLGGRWELGWGTWQGYLNWQG